MTASPFESVAATDAFEEATPALNIPHRGVFVPGWYMAIRDQFSDDTVVLQNGVPILGTDSKPFTIGQVAPERRWPITVSGELMHPLAYQEKGRSHIHLYHKMLKEEGNEHASFKGRDINLAFPSIETYVAQGIDPTDNAKLRAIGYDPNRTAGSTPESLFTQEGVEVESSRMDLLCKAYANKAQRATMKTWEIQEVRAHLELGPEAPASGVDDIAKALGLLLEMKEAGDITDEVYMRKVANLTGADAPTDKSAISDAGGGDDTAESATSTENRIEVPPCGSDKPFKDYRGYKLHLLRCGKAPCVEARAANP